MNIAKCWTGLLMAGFMAVVSEVFGEQTASIRFQGGHPWLSRSRVLDSPELAEHGIKATERPLPGGKRAFDITVSMDQPRTPEERKQIEEVFKYFAWGVYEATEGRHKIGVVRIYEQAGLRVDIEWTKGKGRSNSGIFSGPIKMFDGMGGKSWLSSDTARKRGGFVLAHEWGHYTYGFGEEYDPSDSDAPTVMAGDKHVVPSLMGKVEDAIGLLHTVDYRWLNLSIAWKEGGGAYRDTRQTSQHRLYGKSCMEQLVAPVMPNPIPVHIKHKEQHTVIYCPPSHVFQYPEFSDIDPTTEPKIDLLTATGKDDATSELDIIWPPDPRLMWGIVLDHSGSMNETDLAKAKANAKRTIDTAPVGTLVGIFAFADSVSELVPFTEVTDVNRSSLKANVDTLTSGGSTALWKAADEVLERMDALDPEHNNIGSLLLMTDGGDNASGSITRASVVSKCQAMGVAFNSISYGNGADSALGAASLETGGRNVSSSESLSSLSDAFSRLLTYGSSRETIEDVKGSVPASSIWTEPFAVDSSVTNLQVTVTLSVPSERATVALVSPSGMEYAPNSQTDVGSESSFVFLNASPAAGTWKVSVSASSKTEVSCYVDASACKTPPRLELWIDENDLAAYALLSYGNPVDGAIVKALLHENGKTRAVAFEPIGAGMYKLKLSDCGAIKGGFTVRADAEAGVATYTYVGVMGADGEDEGVPIPESFTRSEWLDYGGEEDVVLVASGKGMLEFQWRTDGDGVPSGITLTCNGTETASLGAGQGWTNHEMVFTDEGLHIFHWATVEKLNQLSGTWLKGVVWHPDPDVAMASIVATPRWPWNGLVDIDFSFFSTLRGSTATFSVSGADGDLGTEVEAKTLTGEYRNLPAGSHRMTWNLGADAPAFHSSAFTVRLDASVDPLPAPSVEIAAATDSGGNKIQWSRVAAANSYAVFRATDADGTDAVELGTVEASDAEKAAFWDFTAPNGKTVWYAVSASAWKLEGQRSAWVPGRRPMSPPTSLTATKGSRDDGISVSWQPSAGTVKSRIYRFVIDDVPEFSNNVIPGEAWGSPVCETIDSSWLDTTAVPGTDYAYGVSCVSDEGEVSALPTVHYYGSVAQVIGDIQLPWVTGYYESAARGWRAMVAPTILSATRKNSHATYKREEGKQAIRAVIGGYYGTSVFSVSWSAVPGAVSYRIEHSPLKSSYSRLDAGTEVVSDTFFTQTDTLVDPFATVYPSGRKYVITPVGKNHNGPATEVTIK